MGTPLDFSEPHLLRNENEYDAAVREIDRLLDREPAPGTVECDRLEFLSVLVEEYDRTHYPMEEGVSSQEAVSFMLEQKGMHRSDLNGIMGGKSRVSEFFSGNRPLSLRQIRGLHKMLGVPVDLLVNSKSF